MKHTYQYIISALVLLLLSPAYAQETVENPPIYNDGYHIEGGVATKKSVSKTMDANGYYTLTLETFATGVTSITQKSIPSDVVLVLDLSTSMGGHRGYLRKLSGATQVSINDIESDDPTYAVYREGHKFGYQISVLVRNNRCYPYCVYRSHVQFFTAQGELIDRSSSQFSYANLYDGGGTIPANAASVANTTAGRANTVVTFSPKTTGTDSDGDGLFDDEVVQTESSRIHELKDAVKAFIDELITNNEKTTLNGQLVDRPGGPLGNKIGIVVWAGIYIQALSTTQMIDATSANRETLKAYADRFTLYDGTKPDLGLEQAKGLFENSNRPSSWVVGEDFLRTAVFFTDGQPDNGFDLAIGKAHDLKSDYSAKVYSVGLFSLAVGASEVDQETQNFMNYTSSNYPDATSYDSPGNPKDSTEDPTNYYQDVSTGEADLTQIFKTIAQASGGSEKTVPSATQVVDGVTNSFTIPTPAGASAPTIASAQVTIYTRSIDALGSTWGSAVPLDIVEMTTDAEIQTPDPTKSYMTDDSKVGVAIKNGRLIVMGFDYSKADSGTTLDGNWVGWRYTPDKTCAGKELVIEFKIQGDPDATGGDDTQTNTPDSGIFIPTYDEDGQFLGYEPVNQYEVPQANIPINLVIQKVGMRHGESATIQIYWAPQSKVYNTETGKLKPDLTNPWPGNGNNAGWGNFSKVILTNKGEDGATVTETLLCLDPTYVYKLEEDNWGWSYDLDDKSIDTSEQEMNPFIFTNKEKTDAVRHAEAASINRFGDELHGRDRVEKVKSSKVKTFITPPATGSSK